MSFPITKIIQLNGYFERRISGTPEQRTEPPDNPNYERNIKMKEIAGIIDTVEALPERVKRVDINPPKFVTEALDYLVNELRAKEGEE